MSDKQMKLVEHLHSLNRPPIFVLTLFWLHPL
jgi:hypothetical protein